MSRIKQEKNLKGGGGLDEDERGVEEKKCRGNKREREEAQKVERMDKRGCVILRGAKIGGLRSFSSSLSVDMSDQCEARCLRAAVGPTRREDEWSLSFFL